MRNLIALFLVVTTVFVAADKASLFSLTDTNGKKIKLNDVIASKGCILVDFWELSCFSCKQALPAYQAIYDKYKNQGFTVLAISVDSVKTVNNVAPYAAGSGFNFPVLLDTNNDVFRDYHVEIMPTCFLVDSKGEIRYTHTGFTAGDEKEIENKVVEILKDYAGEKK